MPSYFLFDNLCKLPKHTHSIASTTTRGARQSKTSIKGAQFTIFKTVFIAIASSLAFWMPALVVYSTREFCQRCFTPLVFWLVDAMYLINYMVNPLVYSFKMQIFKDALHEFWRKRQRNVRPVVQQNSLGFGLEGSFTPKRSTMVWTTSNGVITLWLYSIGDQVKALLEQITLKSTLLKGQNILALKCFIYASDFRVL